MNHTKFYLKTACVEFRYIKDIITRDFNNFTTLFYSYVKLLESGLNTDRLHSKACISECRDQRTF